MDFYTCGPTAKPEEIIEYLYLKLGANSRLIRTFDRSPKLCIFKEE
jgi:S-adenosylmethionine/arginine decarboxylase-like enzyme